MKAENWKEKLHALEGLLASGAWPIFTLDARRAEVTVSDAVRKKYAHELPLQVGHTMPRPIRDLQVGEFGISGTFSFGGVSSFCMVPWEAVYRISATDADGTLHGWVWPSEAPAELGLPVQLAAVEQSVEFKATPTSKSGTHKAPAAAPKRALPAGWAVHEGGKP